MKKNVGNVERAARVAAGLGILSLVFILEGNIRFLGLLGIVPIITGSTGICPLYTTLGISTIKKPKG
ncbi:DUF2892 domain-containing protein [bacterium]|nr:MAG: DUF2892 domain-containing protein [bacterium]